MRRITQTISCWKFILILSSLFFCFQTFSYAADVTLGWDANTEPDLAGYKLYYKAGSCCAPYDGMHPTDPALDSPIDVGNVTQYTITGLSDTETYFFVVAAYDSDDNESGYSNEVTYIPSTLILTSLSISGDDSLNENNSASYTATATFSDGSTLIVTDNADWSDDSDYSSINSSGVLTTSEVSSDETVTIQASFTYGEVTETTTKVMTIVDVPESNLPPSTLILTSLFISGDDSLNENNSASYTATATFSDGSTLMVTDNADWSDDSDYSSINSSGVLTTSEVSSDETVTIQASFTYGEVTETTTKVVTIVDVPESNLPPSRPIIVYPYDGQLECKTSPDITTEPFSDPDGDSHSQSQWQISEQSDFSTLTLDATSNRHLTTVTVPHMVLKSDQTYYVRVRFYDVYFNASNWSDPVGFTTGFIFDDLNSNGIPDAWEVDDTVDLNLDGIPDNYQPEIIKCVQAVDGSSYIGVERISNSISEIEALEVIDPATISNFANKPADLIFGLFSSRLRLNQAGATATVRIYFSGGISQGDIFYKYDSINGWYDYSEHTTFNDNGQSVTLELQDGGYGDSDGLANGIIVDPGGIASGSTVDGASVGDTGAGGGCFIATAAFGSIMERHVRILCEFRDQCLLKSKIGKKFVDFYYKTSPPIADYLRMHPVPKKAVRYALIPVTGLAYLILYVHPVILLLGFSFMIMGLVYGVRRFFRST